MDRGAKALDKDYTGDEPGPGSETGGHGAGERQGFGDGEVIEAEFVELTSQAPEAAGGVEPEALVGGAETAEAVTDWQNLIEAAEEPQAPASDPVVRLVHEYKEAIQARDEWQDKYLRAAAEYANAKRRAEMRADNLIWEARERVLNNVLPVLDDFERAFAALPASERQSTWSEGFDMIYRKLRGVLEREGISEIQAEGSPFDPALHQAIVTESVDGMEPGTVLEVFQKGYRLGERVLRPSMVKVAG